MFCQGDMDFLSILDFLELSTRAVWCVDRSGDSRVVTAHYSFVLECEALRLAVKVAPWPGLQPRKLYDSPGLCHEGPETRWLQTDKCLLRALEVRVQNPGVSDVVLLARTGGGHFLPPVFAGILCLEGGTLSVFLS